MEVTDETTDTTIQSVLTADTLVQESAGHIHSDRHNLVHLYCTKTVQISEDTKCSAVIHIIIQCIYTYILHNV